MSKIREKMVSLDAALCTKSGTFYLKHPIIHGIITGVGVGLLAGIAYKFICIQEQGAAVAFTTKSMFEKYNLADVEKEKENKDE